MSDTPQPITDPAPDPPKAGGGVAGMFGNLTKQVGDLALKTKDATVQTYKKINENENVQKAGQAIGAGAAAAYAGAKVGLQKTGEAAQKGYEKARENETFAKAVDKTTEVGQKTWDKTKEVSQKTWDQTKEVSTQVAANTTAVTGKVVEKSKETYGKVAQRTSEVSGKVIDNAKKGGKAVWEAGRGTIVRVKEQSDAVFNKNAKETLLMREEAAKKWAAMKTLGAEEMVVNARKEYTTSYFIKQGTLLRWSFRVKEHDVGFGVRMRVQMDMGGSEEVDVLPVEKFTSGDTVEGSWVADADRTMVLVFDNKYSMLRSKTVAYLVGTEGGSAEGSGEGGESAAAGNAESAEEAPEGTAEPPSAADDPAVGVETAGAEGGAAAEGGEAASGSAE